ncbi:DUF4111 domain-containing protein [Acuticoccus sp. M5D2P5]|uniref:aminoglycoside adenylyltransferase domain-containing protein n=1 Tax=Acuticoccus kalidii TaxID=2910977 RepID=UPI001F47BF86|nr:aminoglycoside adenylyltransferase domain-containing protein [Acuticoccus kalidii]MCF3935537.1 DUF4111 domain-containing protein [Acuticoccus kalidii]
MAALREVFGEGLVGVYLHGSAVSGGLRPHSDIDILAVVARPLSDEERQGLLAALLAISAPHPAPVSGPRCIEVIVFTRAALGAGGFPAEAEFVFGEWLRAAFEAGEAPGPVPDPENTLILAQARLASHPLYGPGAAALLPPVPAQDVRRAMREALPALLAGLAGDETNVLLTLARMWRTATMGYFVAKDEAALWAAARLPRRAAAVLDLAKAGYRGSAVDWDDRAAEVRRTAACLAERVTAQL